MADLMSKDEIETALTDLDGWDIADDGKAITRKFKFGDFEKAFDFMKEIAPKAEELDHHPEWTNVYNTVDVTLSTHDAGGLTQLDFKLATAMDEAAKTS